MLPRLTSVLSASFLSVAILVSLCAAVDASLERPQWVVHPPASEEGLFFFVGYGEEVKLEDALDIATGRAVAQTAEYVGTNIRSEYRYSRDGIASRVRERITGEASTPEPVRRSLRRETYWEEIEGGYRAWVLISVPAVEIESLVADAREEENERRRSISQDMDLLVDRITTALEGGSAGVKGRVVVIDPFEAESGSSGEMGIFLGREVALRLGRSEAMGVVVRTRPAEVADQLGVSTVEIPSMLSEAAEALDADLVVAGIYGRSREGRVEIRLLAGPGPTAEARIEVLEDRLPNIPWTALSWIPIGPEGRRRLERTLVSMLLGGDTLVSDLVEAGYYDLRESSSPPRAAFRRGVALLAADRPRSAYNAFSSFVLQPSGAVPEGYALKGIAAARAGRPAAEALGAFDHALILDFHLPEAHLGAAACLLYMGRADEAYLHLEYLAEEAGRRE